MFEAGYKTIGVVLAVLMGSTLIEVPSWGTVTLVEALWTLAGVLMVAVSLWALPRVVGDYTLTRRVPGHYSLARTLLARGHVRREALRLVQGIIVVTIGAYATLATPPQPGPSYISPVGIVLTAGLILLAAITAVQSILDRRQRDQAERLIVSADVSLPNEPDGEH